MFNTKSFLERGFGGRTFVTKRPETEGNTVSPSFYASPLFVTCFRKRFSPNASICFYLESAFNRRQAFTGLRAGVGGMVQDLVSLFLNSVFVGNILLAYFLGMCSFLAVSKNLDTAFGLGMAVVFVLTITTPVNWLVYRFLLAPGALAWAGLPQIDLSFLKFIIFIVVIAAMVQVVEMVIDRYSQSLYTALGVFLPLIA